MRTTTGGSAKDLMSNWRWWICSLLFFATTINYMDRQVLSLTYEEFIKPQFHWTDADYGTVTSFFSIFYAFACLFAGKFIDWIGTRKGYIISIIVWSVGACMHAFCGVAALKVSGLVALSFSTVSVYLFLLCRGVLYQRLRKGYRNPWVAILVNPIVFVLMHILLPGITVWAVLSIYLVGVTFGLMVYYLDSLWMAMAAHAAWNFTQNFIFGLPNSGTVYDFSIFKINSATARTSLCYNVEFGVEASVTAVLAFAFASAILLCLGKKKNLKSLDVWES